MRKNPYGRPFVDVVRFTNKFERCHEANDRNKFLGAKKVRFDLGLHLHHQIGTITLERNVVLRGMICKSECLVIDCSSLMILHRSKSRELRFFKPYFVELPIQLNSCEI